MRGSRLAAWALTVALILSFLANCVPVEAATAAQQACCAAMNHDCGLMAAAQDCCVVKSLQVGDFTVAKTVSLPAPSAYIVLHALAPELLNPSADSSRYALNHASRLTPSGVPRYLLVATLLI